MDPSPRPGAGPGGPPDAGAVGVLPDDQVSLAVEYLAMLAEPTRLRLLWALRDGEVAVGELAEAAGCTPTAASQHLGKLRLAGVVEQRAVGRSRLYRLRGGRVRRVLEEAVGQAGGALGEPGTGAGTGTGMGVGRGVGTGAGTGSGTGTGAGKGVGMETGGGLSGEWKVGE